MGKKMIASLSGRQAEFELPWPPSVNHYYRHVGPRVLISREGRQYRETVIAKIRDRLPGVFAGQAEFYAEFYPPDNRRRDLDNLLKCVLDTLQHAGVYQDDSQIAKITAIKHQPMPPLGMAYIRITPWNADKIMEDVAKLCRHS